MTLTNAQKARAWDEAAGCLANSTDWNDGSAEGRHIWDVVIPHLQAKARIIRRNKKTTHKKGRAK